MDQIRKHIIFALYIHRIIFESSCIYFNRSTGKYFNYSVFQTIIIHIDKRNNCFIRSSLRPVTSKPAPHTNTYYCFRIIYLIVLQQITIIPIFYFLKISVISFAKILHFSFCKSNIWRHHSCIKHCKFIKII